MVKAEVCKTSTLRFESGRRLQSQLSFPPKALRQLEVATIEAEAKEAALHLPEAPPAPLTPVPSPFSKPRCSPRRELGVVSEIERLAASLRGRS